MVIEYEERVRLLGCCVVFVRGKIALPLLALLMLSHALHTWRRPNAPYIVEKREAFSSALSERKAE